MANTNDIDINEQFVGDSFNEYVLQKVDINNIIPDLNLSDEESALVKSIILSLEEEASKCIKENLVVTLPNMGTIRRDNFNDVLRNHNKEIKFARANMTKEDFRDYMKDLRKAVRADIKESYLKRRLNEQIRRGKFKIYERLAVERGKTYAELYVKAIHWLRSVDYDPDVQKQFDIINGVL